MALNLKSAALAIAVTLSIGLTASSAPPASASTKTDSSWCASVATIHKTFENTPKAPTKYTSRRLALVSADKRGSYLYRELNATQRAYEHAPNIKLKGLYASVYSVLSERYNTAGDQVHAVSALSPESSGAQVTSTMKRVAREDEVAAKRALSSTQSAIKAGAGSLTKACGSASAKDLQGF